MKIYTKTGDDGQTSLIGGERVSKCSSRICAYGTSDELNSYVGWLRAKGLEEEEDKILLLIQNQLFNLGAFLATPIGQDIIINVNESTIQLLEDTIDKWSQTLPIEHAFILPSGNEKIALCHVTRTIARRLEREMIKLFSENEVTGNGKKNEKLLKEEAISIRFVNRLSDFLFILAKKIAKNDHCRIFLWEK